MRYIYCIAIVFGVALLFNGCEKDSAQSIDLGQNYYPTTLNSWRIYDVDSIVHNDFTGTIETFSYQVKDVITNEFNDLEGRPSLRIERFFRDSITKPWILTSVYYSTKTTVRLEVVEQNIRSMKLKFPVSINDDWNGNAFNSLDSRDFKYKSVDKQETIGGNALDSVLTVLQLDDENLIEKYFEEEKYARSVGLVSKTSISLDYQADSGLEYYLTLNSYGVN